MAPPPHTNDKDREEQDITSIKEIIKQVLEDLETGEKRKAEMAMNSLQQVLRTLNAWDHQERRQGQDTVAAKLTSLEKAITQLTKAQEKPKPTWASVAAAPGFTQALNQHVGTPITSKRTTVRVRPQSPVTGDNTIVLDTVKKGIPEAIAVRKLQSGDINVFIKDKETRDQVLQRPPQAEIKVLHQDFPIEVPGIPLSIPVSKGRLADNTALLAQITQETKKMYQGENININFTAARWLHQDARNSERQRANAQVKTRGTLLLSCATQEAQEAIVKKGVIISGGKYDAHLFDWGNMVKQCFNCNQ